MLFDSWRTRGSGSESHRLYWFLVPLELLIELKESSHVRDSEEFWAVRYGSTRESDVGWWECRIAHSNKADYLSKSHDLTSQSFLFRSPPLLGVNVSAYSTGFVICCWLYRTIYWWDMNGTFAWIFQWAFPCHCHLLLVRWQSSPFKGISMLLGFLWNKRSRYPVTTAPKDASVFWLSCCIFCVGLDERSWREGTLTPYSNFEYYRFARLSSFEWQGSNILWWGDMRILKSKTSTSQCCQNFHRSIITKYI